MHTPIWCRTTEFDVATHMGRGLPLGVSHAPTPWGRGHIAPQFLWLLSVYAYTLCRRTAKFDVVTHVYRDGLFYESLTPPPPTRRGPAIPNFWGFPSVLCVHRTTKSQNYQVWRGNTCGGGVCILGSATPSITREQSSRAPQFLRFSCINAYTL